MVPALIKPLLQDSIEWQLAKLRAFPVLLWLSGLNLCWAGRVGSKRQTRPMKGYYENKAAEGLLEGVSPSSLLWQGSISNLRIALPMEPLRGIEPRSAEYKTAALPLDDRGMTADHRHTGSLYSSPERAYADPDLRWYRLRGSNPSSPP